MSVPGDRLRGFFFGPGRASQMVRAVVGSAGLRIIGMALGFLVGVQLARGLGAADYGVYGIAMSVISLMMVPTEFGIPQLVTREVAAADAAGHAGLARAILAWAGRVVFANCLVLVLVAAVVLATGSVVNNAELARALGWGLLMLPVVAASNVLSAALRGKHRIIDGQLAELVLRPGLLSALLLAFTLSMGGGALTPALAIALNVAAALAGATYAWQRLAPVLPAAPQVRVAGDASRRWLASALPLAMGDGMRIFSGQLAVLVLGALASTTEVGIYRVAFGIYMVATLPSALLNAACSPMLAKLHEEGRPDAIQRLAAWMVLFLVAAALACIVPFALAGTQIISLIFGSEYAGSGAVLMVLLLGELAAALLGHPTIMLNMLRRERVVTWFSGLSLALNLVLCTALVPRFGGIGAAIGIASSQVCWRLAASIYARRQLGYHTSLLAWIPALRSNPR